MKVGGEGGIRTHGTLARTPVFETGLFNHSSTSPENIRSQSISPAELALYSPACPRHMMPLLAD